LLKTDYAYGNKIWMTMCVCVCVGWVVGYSTTLHSISNMTGSEKNTGQII